MSAATQEISSTKIAQAAVWTSGSILVVRLFFLISSIITARLLTSEDFGLIGIAGAVYMLIDTTSATGIGSFIIYKQDLSVNERNTAFTLNLLIGLFFGSLVILAGVIASHFYHKEGIRQILLYSGVAFFLSTIGGIPRALLIKRMNQQILAIIDISVNFLNFVLIIFFAFRGFKYLSYVIPVLIYQSICTMALYIAARQSFKLVLDRNIFLRILSYSRSFTPQILLADFLYQADYLIGSAFLTSAMIGYYYFGFEKAFLISVFTRGVSEQVLFPVFSKVQTETSLLREKYFKLSSYFMFMLFPVLIFVIFQAKEILLLVYGNQWNNSIFTFQCILGFFFLKVGYDISVTLFNAVGKTDQNLRHFLSVVPHTLLFFMIGVTQAGIAGLAVAAFLGHGLSALLMMNRLKLNFGWPLREQLWLFVRHIVPASIPLPLTLVLKYFLLKLNIHPFLLIVNQVILFLALYLILSKLLNPEIFNEVYGFIKQKLQRGAQAPVTIVEDVLPEN